MYKRLLIVLIFLMSECAIAQKRYAVAHYTSDNGLPQNSVKNIVSDSEGFIWLATEDGLVRYDGHHFYIFNRFNLNLAETRVSDILSERPGVSGRSAVSYATFIGGEVARIEKGTAVLDTAFYAKRKRHVKSVSSTRAIYRSAGLPGSISEMSFVNDKNIHIFQAGDSESNYLCDSSSISYYSKWKKQYQFPYKVNLIYTFFTIGKNLYHFNKDASITGFANKKATPMEVSGEILSDPAYRVNKLQTKIYSNNLADQSYLYINKNLYTLKEKADPVSGHTVLVTKLLIEDFDMQGRIIKDIYYDKINGKIFLGSGTQGLFVLSKQSFGVVNIDGDDRHNVFYGQMPFGENAVVTPNGFVLGKDPKNGKTIARRSDALFKVNQWDGAVIIRDRNESVWVKDGEELFHLDRIDMKVKGRWSFQYDVKSIHQGKLKQVWFGVIKEGLFSINPQDTAAKPKIFMKEPFTQITYLDSESPDRLWVGTAAGLYVVDIQKKKIRLIDGTRGLYIKSVHVFDNGQIWVTALEKGLMLIDHEGNLVSFPLDKKQYLASPHCVISDNRGYLWIPTNKGLFQMAVADLLGYAKMKIRSKPAGSTSSVELFYMYHSKDEGFYTNEFNGGCQPCALQLKNGYISLPSLNGFVWFKPEMINNHFSAGKIVLDKVMVNQQELNILQDKLYFPLNPERISLYFSTPFFGNNYNLNLSYALLKEGESGNPDWVSMNKEDFEIEFSTLNSGNYTLMVRKLNGFGLDNYTVKKIYFVVPLLWYETWWAKVLFTFILLLGVYFYNKLKMRKIERENEMLEAIVKKRTESLNNALVDLEESKNDMSRQVRMLSRLLTSMTHDVQSPLNYITLTSGRIPRMISQKKFVEVSAMGSLISDSSKRMSGMLRDLLDYIKIQVYGNRMKFEDIELKKLIDEKLEILKNVIVHNGSDFYNEVPADLIVFSDYQMLSILIHNLIDNAAKFTHHGKIRVHARADQDERIELIISNTSTGVPDDLFEMINSLEDDERLPDSPGKIKKKTGMGLLIVKEVATLVGITLKVTQTDQTHFHLFFE